VSLAEWGKALERAWQLNYPDPPISLVDSTIGFIRAVIQGEPSMKNGIFKGRALTDVQFGETTNGHPQLAIVMRMLAENQTQDATTFLIFSPESAPYSFDRLRALGWEGNDLTNLKGIDKNEVDVRVWTDDYQGKPQVKCEIIGGGRVTLAKPLSKEAFAAKVAALTGAPVGGAGGSRKSEIPF
jgi:hypothetical protein